jgi:hypothetical protein
MMDTYSFRATISSKREVAWRNLTLEAANMIRWVFVYVESEKGKDWSLQRADMGQVRKVVHHTDGTRWPFYIYLPTYCHDLARYETYLPVLCTSREYRSQNRRSGVLVEVDTHLNPYVIIVEYCAVAVLPITVYGAPTTNHPWTISRITHPARLMSVDKIPLITMAQIGVLLKWPSIEALC